jgi:Co/Zn/Cd efflux system component
MAFNLFHLFRKYRLFIILAGIFLAWQALFQLFNVNVIKYYTPALYPPFADLITITHSVDCLNAGSDPYVDTSFDPFGRTFNYPFIILKTFQILHLGGNTTLYLAVFLVLLYIFILSYLYRKSLGNQLNLGFILPVLLSPAFILLWERGNFDMIVIMLFGLFAIFKFVPLFSSKAVIRESAYLFLLYASMIKLYPVVVLFLMMFFDQSMKHRLIKILAMFIVFVGYLFLIKDQLELIMSNTPQATYLSYGRKVLFQEFWSSNSIGISVLSVVTSALAIVIPFLIFRKNGPGKTFIESTTSNPMAATLFLLGTGTYLFTFLLSNNFDYRLTLLTLSLPMLIIAYSTSENKKMYVVLFAAFLIKVYQYLPYTYLGFHHDNQTVMHVVFLIEQVSSWLVFSILFYLFFNLCWSKISIDKFKLLTSLFSKVA